MKILVADLYEIEVEICHLLNSVGEECSAKISDMRGHIRWHAIRDHGAKVIRYCRAGQHEYLKSAVAPSTVNCQAHIEKSHQRPEKGKRMMSSGMEFKENVKAV